MSISVDFGDELEKLAEYTARVESNLVAAFRDIGEYAVKIAREKGSYTDRTGNLRHSIGYVILSHGTPIEQAIQGPAEAVAETSRMFAELYAQYAAGLTLIVGAGMRYAAEVEMRGYDVLLSAELYLEQVKRNIADFVNDAHDTAREQMQ